MIKTIQQSLSITLNNSLPSIGLYSKLICWFANNHHSIYQVLREKQHAKISNIKIGDNQLIATETRGAVSIIEPPPLDPSNQLYVMSYTCQKCKNRSSRSFTKSAYENGVVLTRCTSCQNINLVVDNLGWFQRNLE